MKLRALLACLLLAALAAGAPMSGTAIAAAPSATPERAPMPAAPSPADDAVESPEDAAPSIEETDTSEAPAVTEPVEEPAVDGDETPAPVDETVPAQAPSPPTDMDEAPPVLVPPGEPGARPRQPPPGDFGARPRQPLPIPSRDDRRARGPVPTAPIRPATPAAETIATPPGLPALSALTKTRERPLFVPGRRGPAPAVDVVEIVAPPEDVAPEEAKPTALNRQLSGLVSGPGVELAILVDPSSHAVARVRVGEEHDGWRLSEVGRTSATFRRGEESTVLELRRVGEHRGGVGGGEDEGQPPQGMPLMRAPTPARHAVPPASLRHGIQPTPPRKDLRRPPRRQPAGANPPVWPGMPVKRAPQRGEPAL